MRCIALQGSAAWELHLAQNKVTGFHYCLDFVGYGFNVFYKQLSLFYALLLMQKRAIANAISLRHKRFAPHTVLV